MAPPIDTTDPTAQASVQQMRSQLSRRINSHPQPSRLINQLGLADQRCANTTKALMHLTVRAPKVLKVIRAALRKAFDIDPDKLLFTETMSPSAPHRVDTLTERTLLSLALPAVPINLNQFTTLSVKDEPARVWPLTPLQVLQQVLAMKLFERLGPAFSRYWETLVAGSWQTRQEHWCQLQAELFADRAFIAGQLGELSSEASSLVQALIDAPSPEARQRAGGDWASVRASQLMWPGSPAVAIPGALHIYRADDPSDVPHVIYLPGVARNFYEYPSFFFLQCGLLKLTSQALFDELWQCLPLKRRHELCRPTHYTPASSVARGSVLDGDALALSAQALLDGQWENELACALAINQSHLYSQRRPPPQPLTAAPFLTFIERARKQLVGEARLGASGKSLLEWDARRRRREICFANLLSGQPMLAMHARLKRYEKGLLALLDVADPSVDTTQFQEVVALARELQEHAQTMDSLSSGAQKRLYEYGFWIERPTQTEKRATLFLQAQGEALRCEVQLQHRLKLIPTAHRDLVIKIVDQHQAAKREYGDARVLSVSVGSAPDAFYHVHNLMVVTTATAVEKPGRSVPVVLCGFGQSGGVLSFSSLQALTKSLLASFNSSDESVLWRCIERKVRQDLRKHAARGTLAVRYELIEKGPLEFSFKKLMKHYGTLHTSSADATQLFGEVKSPAFSRDLLLIELGEHLKVPANDLLEQSQAHLDVLRKATADAKKLPAWLAGASSAQRKTFKKLQGRHLASVLAVENRLEQRLEDLETFARTALIARLTEDGFYPGLDIEQPLLTMPDDVASSFCGYESRCTPGDRKEIQTPSLERSTFSLLQLALHNLDPQAPWTRKRLNHATYLQPDWRKRLDADYLIKTISALDIGGQYAAKIERTFEPAAQGLSEGRIPELMQRMLRDCAKVRLYSAIRQGLSAPAQSLFNTAMAARTPEDLLKNGHRLSLSVVHLVGHTLQHDRYIAGIVVMQDQANGRCVVYWPNAATALAVTEYASVQEAHVALNRIATQAEHAKQLARQVAPGWAFEAVTHDAEPDATLDELLRATFFSGVWRGVKFIRSFAVKHLEPTPVPQDIEKQFQEQVDTDPLNALAIVPTAHSDANALLYKAWVLDLQRRTQAACNSSKALDRYRTKRLEEQSDTRMRALVGFFVPPYGMVNDFYELLLAARRYHRFGRSSDAVDVGFMSIFLTVELLLGFIPGAKTRAGAVGGITRRSLATGLSRIRHLHMTAPRTLAAGISRPITQLKALEHFRLKGVPQDAVALKGVGEKGVYVKNGEAFLADDTHRYPVYRRQNEHSLRLKNKQAGEEDELLVHIYQPEEWLLGADAPTPGPSSGTHRPWQPPRPDVSDWQPPVRVASEDRIRQFSTTATHWLDWQTQLHPGQLSSSPAPGIFHVAADPQGYPHHVLRVAPERSSLTDPSSRFYRLLPPGEDAGLHGIVFITRNEPLVSLASVDILRWTSNDLLEQPLPASRTATGAWHLHAPIFDRPLEQSVAIAFPTLTNRTRDHVVSRLIELSGPARPATATHLLRVRATLDEWLPPAPVRPGRTDDLLRMLRPTDRAPNTTFISFQGAAPGLTRIDFLPPVRPPRTLRRGGKAVASERNTAQYAAVSTLLEEQGFTLRHVNVRRYGTIRRETLATHPNSPSRLYYVSYLWAERPSLRLFSTLSDNWLVTGLRTYTNVALADEVSSAMRQQRLVRILAGIQWPTGSDVSPTVYFIKLNP
ncbi:dermonecrotic toxin domain-containing protein [Pseudomonas lactis]|uniref:dermonecrotic toxin domain-containing protein n=2 Tax=Pseudomonas TaxID=286 RepID=UPI001F043DF0|nr:DUF6543 domain-containing protein [Pseudomonas lactis]